MATLNEVLAKKGKEVYCVAPSDMIIDTIKTMADKAVGTALVMQDGKISGILSERDVIRKVVVAGQSPDNVKVEDIMTKDVMVGQTDSSIDECLQLMTGERIRHLPVVEDNEVAGIVSIGDLVKFKLSEQDETIRDYQKYIYQAY
jgi:CBS domain-containing protein